MKREKDQSDFDLETFIDLFDEALSSEDPRVKRTLQDLLIVTTLVRSAETNQTEMFERKGPLRRLYDDVNNLTRRINQLDHDKVWHELANQKPNVSMYPAITVRPNTGSSYPYVDSIPQTIWSNLGEDPNIKPYLDDPNIKPYLTAIKNTTTGEDC